MGTQFVFSDLETCKPDEWNVYSDIKRKPVEIVNIQVGSTPTLELNLAPGGGSAIILTKL